MRSNAIAAVHLGHVEEDFSNNVGALDEPKIILQAVDHALNHVKWWLVIEENDYACGASKNVNKLDVCAISFLITWYLTGAAGFSRRMVRATSVPDRCMVAIWKLT